MSRNILSLGPELLAMQGLIKEGPIRVMDLVAEVGLDRTVVNCLPRSLKMMGHANQDINHLRFRAIDILPETISEPSRIVLEAV